MTISSMGGIQGNRKFSVLAVYQGRKVYKKNILE